MGSDGFGLLGKEIDGKYRVDEVVGEGGFGVVFKGMQLSFERPIAIKCLKVPAHFTAEARSLFHEKFREEGKHLAQLSDHPSIINVYDFGITEGAQGQSVPYLVLEWLEGHDLESVLRDRDEPFGEREALEVIRPAIEALAFAHASNVAHRDVKPANLFVAKGALGEVLKVLDFGIAKAMQEGETATQIATKTSSGFSAFSPSYGAPEQFRAKKYGATGPWTDVHALGLILVEMCTGKQALEGEDMGDFFVSSIAEDRPTPRRRGAKVSEAFEALCRAMLALSPRHRFADAKELLRAVDAFMAGEPMDLPSPDGGTEVIEPARGGVVKTVFAEPVDPAPTGSTKKNKRKKVAATAPDERPVVARAPARRAAKGPPSPLLLAGVVAVVGAGGFAMYVANQETSEPKGVSIPDSATFRAGSAKPTGVPFPSPGKHVEPPETKRASAKDGAPGDLTQPPADAQKTSSGLVYRVLKRGTSNEHPTANDSVEVHYEGWTQDGEKFDSSRDRGKPATFPLGRVIKGWTEGVQLMSPGDTYRFWIPAELAYGEEPQGNKPGGLLVFDIELLGLTRAAATPPRVAPLPVPPRPRFPTPPRPPNPHDDAYE